MDGRNFSRRDFIRAAAIAGAGLFVGTEKVFAREETPQQVGFMHPTLASNSTEDVGVRLVCVFDTSGSINLPEYQVQLEAMASAIESDDFKNAIFYEGGPKSIAICVMDFDHFAQLRVPWIDIREGDEIKLELVAEEMRRMGRLRSGGTNHVPALELSDLCFRNCRWQSEKSIVDIITDGRSQSSIGGVQFMRQQLLIDHDATINALVTLTSSESDLPMWCRENLITKAADIIATGSSADVGFVHTVATQMSVRNPGAIVEYNQEMQQAFKRKLILEVAGIDIGLGGNGIIRAPGPGL